MKKINKPCTLKEISLLIKGKLIGDENIKITGVAGLEDAGNQDISFLAHPKYKSSLAKTNAAALILSKAFPEIDKPYIIVDNPYLALAVLLKYFYAKPKPVVGVHPLSVIGKNPKLGKNISIYPWAVIGDDVQLDDNVVIYSGACIGCGVKIGADSVIYPQVSIYDEVSIGCKVVIHSGTVIGCSGFGYVWDGRRHHHIPQIGSVIIEDDVQIGANVTIDRGSMGNTHIARGVRIDNLVQIAHNVSIGENSIIVAQVGISGSSRLGCGVILGGQVGVVGHVKIGDNVKVAAKGGISKDVPADAVMAGMIGRPYAEWKKTEVAMRNLVKLQNTVKELQQRINLLEEEKSGT